MPVYIYKNGKYNLLAGNYISKNNKPLLMKDDDYMYLSNDKYTLGLEADDGDYLLIYSYNNEPLDVCLHSSSSFNFENVNIEIKYSNSLIWESYTINSIIHLNKNENVKFRGKYNNEGFSKNSTQYFYFSFSKKTIVSGSVTSLLGKINKQLKPYSFYKLFSNCRNLIEPPKLSNAYLADYCYGSMFENCESLSFCPGLPASELKPHCYDSMFKGCKSIKKSPILHSKVLVEGCYNNMFNGCSSLNSIEVKFSDWKDQSGPYGTLNWVKDVANSGIFNGPADLKEIEDINHIPLNWVDKTDYLKFTSIKDGITNLFLIEFSPSENLKLPSIEYSKNNGPWKPYNNFKKRYERSTNKFERCGDDIVLYKNDQCRFRNLSNYFSHDETNFYRFSCSDNKNDIGIIKASGSVLTLLKDGEKTLDISNTKYIFRNLFLNFKSLITPPKLKAKKLSVGCYWSMFENCTNLENMPELPANDLTESCYNSMFKGCIKLKSTLSILSAKNLGDYCYSSMFSNCYSLEKTPLLPAENLSKYCYSHMFENCDKLIQPAILNSTNISEGCYQGMFENCNSLTTSSDLPAVEINWYSIHAYEKMFKNCINLKTVNTIKSLEFSKDYTRGRRRSFPRYCFCEMFSGCKNLKYVLGNNITIYGGSIGICCFESLFENCSSLSFNNIIMDFSGDRFDTRWIVWVPGYHTYIHYSNCFLKMFYGIKSINNIIINQSDFKFKDYGSFDHVSKSEWVYNSFEKFISNIEIGGTLISKNKKMKKRISSYKHDGHTYEYIPDNFSFLYEE